MFYVIFVHFAYWHVFQSDQTRDDAAGGLDSDLDPDLAAVQNAIEASMAAEEHIEQEKIPDDIAPEAEQHGSEQGDLRVELAIKRGYIYPSNHFTRSDGVAVSINRLRTDAIHAGADPDEIPGSHA